MFNVYFQELILSFSMRIFNVSNVTVNKRVMFNLKFLKYHNFHKNTKQHDSFQHIKMISEGSWDTKDS